MRAVYCFCARFRAGGQRQDCADREGVVSPAKGVNGSHLEGTGSGKQTKTVIDRFGGEKEKRCKVKHSRSIMSRIKYDKQKNDAIRTNEQTWPNYYKNEVEQVSGCRVRDCNQATARERLQKTKCQRADSDKHRATSQ